MIKAPFNFVPLADKVFFPKWADQVSQDLPFSDGLDGYIEVLFTAKTPVFVRNGHSKDDAEKKNDQYRTFSTIEDKPYIPSSSIKGSIRNVLEILSFGKMSRIDDKRYSIRDLKLKEEYLQQFSTSTVHCGWMTQDGDTIIISDRGLPRRVSHWSIDLKLHTKLCELCMDKKKFEADKDKNRLALAKYELVGSQNLTYKFKELPMDPENPVDQRIKVHFDDNGQFEGTIVFTGQPGIRKPKEGDKKASGKFYEFVFSQKEECKYYFSATQEKGLFEDFCFIYKDSEDWKYWAKKMKDGQAVPVFFIIENNQIKHFGLSYLYKLPSPKRMKGFLYKDHVLDKPDLADCIFGYVSPRQSLKGRVHFSNAFAVEGSLDEENLVYMGSPKPTYYPIYIKQNGTNGYMLNGDRMIPFKTLLSRDSILRGWKRYPIREEAITYFNIPEGQEDNSNPFIPMCTGSKFACRVYYHNLRVVELGALVYALSLRPNCCHSIGFAKAYGYGALSTEVSLGTSCPYTIDQLKESFINRMCDEIENYKQSPIINEFFCMAKTQQLANPSQLEYMELDDFVSCKQQNLKKQIYGEYLPNYSELVKKKSAVVVKEETVEEAIAFIGRNIKQAKLTQGNDQQYHDLEVVGRAKIKDGEKIKVTVVRKSGKIKKIIFNGN